MYLLVKLVCWRNLPWTKVWFETSY